MAPAAYLSTPKSPYLSGSFVILCPILRNIADYVLNAKYCSFRKADWCNSYNGEVLFKDYQLALAVSYIKNIIFSCNLIIDIDKGWNPHFPWFIIFLRVSLSILDISLTLFVKSVNFEPLVTDTHLTLTYHL